jgi:hypothetical protein
MENKHLDNMSYICKYCQHKWIFWCDILGTLEQIRDWFENVKQEHLMYCETYREFMRGDKYND